jgi:hypothetical protein
MSCFNPACLNELAGRGSSLDGCRCHDRVGLELVEECRSHRDLLGLEGGEHPVEVAELVSSRSSRWVIPPARACRYGRLPAQFPPAAVKTDPLPLAEGDGRCHRREG